MLIVSMRKYETACFIDARDADPDISADYTLSFK